VGTSENLPGCSDDVLPSRETGVLTPEMISACSSE
jgi:hypothetical protein